MYKSPWQCYIKVADCMVECKDIVLVEGTGVLVVRV